MKRASGKKQQKYVNRELSWLEFNQRVLDQAKSEQNPLLERLKFLAITGSNLDEFFMVRVGGLKLQALASPDRTGIAGNSPHEQLEAIRQRVTQMYADQYSCYSSQIEPALNANRIVRLKANQLNQAQRTHLQRVFEEEILSVISPICVSEPEDFPRMIGAPIGLCIKVEGATLGALDPEKPASVEETTRQHRFVVLTLARGMPRFLSVPSNEGFQFVLIEDVVELFADRFFPNQTVLECVVFRATPNADIRLDEDAVADLLADITALLDARTTSDCVRLEMASSAREETRRFLQKSFKTDDADTYLTPGPIDLSALMSLATMQGFQELKNEPWHPQASPDFPPDEDIFKVISSRDRLLMHPYQSYDPVVEFLKAAAADPNVIAIKQTLYRVGGDSQIVTALRDAASSGKNVTVIVELKARFDERRNISWAQQLERAGAEVIYGVRGLKTHAKMCIAVRRESAGIKRYMHFATGNYNESTARLYSDISLFTCDAQTGTDAINLFNAITGLSIPQPMQKLVAAPRELRSRLLELIEVETANARQGREAGITAKVNSLSDQSIIDALYRASQAGVKIRLNVRGICCLRPGVKGLSESIEVVSIVDRFLEHARIFHFPHAGDELVYIASADWMGRNLDRRVELMIPVEDQQCKIQLLDALNAYFKDDLNSSRLTADGLYSYQPNTSGSGFRVQQHLYSVAVALDQAHRQEAKSKFQPHRADRSVI